MSECEKNEIIENINIEFTSDATSLSFSKMVIIGIGTAAVTIFPPACAIVGAAAGAFAGSYLGFKVSSQGEEALVPILVGGGVGGLIGGAGGVITGLGLSGYIAHEVYDYMTH
jgi:hypothetical protein